MTLTCENKLAQQEPYVRFQFLRYSQVLGQGWNKSSQLQVAAVRSEDSGFYWCEAQTAANRMTRSRGVRVHVQSERLGRVEWPRPGFVTAGSCLKSPSFPVAEPLSHPP